MRDFKGYIELPCNLDLRDRARELRQAGNLSEVLLWKRLNKKQFRGFDFDRQKIIGNYIVDFYCLNKGVVIEVDGTSHDDKKEYDTQRDAFLMGLELTVIHIKAEDVLRQLPQVMEMLYGHPALK